MKLLCKDVHKTRGKHFNYIVDTDVIIVCALVINIDVIIIHICVLVVGGLLKIAFYNLNVITSSIYNAFLVI